MVGNDVYRGLVRFGEGGAVMGDQDRVTDDDVVRIRAYIKMGYSNVEIANACDRAPSTISRIRHDKLRFDCGSSTQRAESARVLESKLLHSAWDAQARKNGARLAKSKARR
jgi:IS30 family transposase